MAIPHVIEWHEGAPENPQAGMLVQWHDGSIDLAGTDSDFDHWDKVLRWAWAIKPHELTWAASMAKRQLAK